MHWVKGEEGFRTVTVNIEDVKVDIEVEAS